MKFLTSKHFKFQMSQLSHEERSQFLDYIMEVASWKMPQSHDRFINSILEEHMKPYVDHKNKISDIRREVGASSRQPKQKSKSPKPTREWTEEEIEKWFDEPEDIQKKYWLWKYWVNLEDTEIDIVEENNTIVQESPNNCEFPLCPWKDDIFPEPELSKLWPKPDWYNKNTPDFWNIFLTLDIDALSSLPFTWTEIATDIQDRIDQIAKVQALHPFE